MVATANCTRPCCHMQRSSTTAGVASQIHGVGLYTECRVLSILYRLYLYGSPCCTNEASFQHVEGLIHPTNTLSFPELADQPLLEFSSRDEVSACFGKIYTHTQTETDTETAALAVLWGDRVVPSPIACLGLLQGRAKVDSSASLAWRLGQIREADIDKFWP